MQATTASCSHPAVVMSRLGRGCTTQISQQPAFGVHLLSEASSDSASIGEGVIKHGVRALDPRGASLPRNDLQSSSLSWESRAFPASTTRELRKAPAPKYPSSAHHNGIQGFNNVNYPHPDDLVYKGP